ncbi:MAG TPA: HAMP domain-containing sensor histidine kinase, partial [Actinomycetota bacterium]|nr:HAMP domain-containing sensor histidine kinase [Actinomycetota bacterium]
MVVNDFASSGLTPPKGNLRVLPHGSGGPSEVSQAITTVIRRARAALRPHDATVRISLPDRTGRLRLAAVVGSRADTGRKRSERRRLAFVSGATIRLSLRSLPGHELAIIPLLAGHSVVGLVEVIATTEAMEDRWKALDKSLDLAADLLREARERADLKAETDALSAANLARTMVRASTPQAALQAVVSFYFERFGVPVAAWLSEAPGREAELVGARGLGPRKTAQLRQEMSTIPWWGRLTVNERTSVSESFGEIVGGGTPTLLHVGDALLIAGGMSLMLKRSLGVVGPLLEDVFSHLATVTWAERRNEHLDLGLAATAHEVRGPLVGARAAIERLMITAPDPGRRELLRRSNQELSYLSELVDSLLRWSIGAGGLRRRRTDLTRLAREAAESCMLERGERRVTVTGSRPATVMADGKHIRAAVSNLIRNALQYSPWDRPVIVQVEPGVGSVTLRVKD